MSFFDTTCFAYTIIPYWCTSVLSVVFNYDSTRQRSRRKNSVCSPSFTMFFEIEWKSFMWSLFYYWRNIQTTLLHFAFLPYWVICIHLRNCETGCSEFIIIFFRFDLKKTINEKRSQHSSVKTVFHSGGPSRVYNSSQIFSFSISHNYHRHELLAHCLIQRPWHLPQMKYINSRERTQIDLPSQKLSDLMKSLNFVSWFYCLYKYAIRLVKWLRNGL